MDPNLPVQPWLFIAAAFFSFNSDFPGHAGGVGLNLGNRAACQISHVSASPVFLLFWILHQGASNLNECREVTGKFQAVVVSRKHH